MKHKHIVAGASAALFLTTTSHAAYLRWMGIDMNTDAQSTVTTLQHVDTTQAGSGPGFSSPISSLASAPYGAGPNGMNLTGSATVGSGTSYATTAWNINGVTDTLAMSMNHGISGGIAPNNFAGSEGVIYFYALTAGTISVTYDYGFEETDPTTTPYKASDRGRSKGTVRNNARGLGDDAGGPTEIVNRDGSRTFNVNVGPSDDLLAFSFDFRILENPQETTISGGYVNMTFTPIPEPSGAMLGLLGGLGLLVRRRARA